MFITLPSVFNQMWGGRLWGALFFLCMSCAALSTVIAVFENLISFSMDQWDWSRKKAVAVNGVAVTLLSLPDVYKRQDQHRAGGAHTQVQQMETGCQTCEGR